MNRSGKTKVLEGKKVKVQGGAAMLQWERVSEARSHVKRLK